MEEQRTREETARLEAIRQAEVEKARLEAESQARMTALAAQQQHERQLVAIKTDQSKKTLRNALIGLGVVAVLAAAGGGFWAYNTSQENARREAALIQEKQKIEEERKQLDADLKAQAQKVRDLEDAVGKEKDERKKAELQAKLNEAKAAEEETKTKLGGTGGGARPAGGGGETKPAVKPACNCKPTDPLCDCL
jgi:colicin import membrane protein